MTELLFYLLGAGLGVLFVAAIVADLVKILIAETLPDRGTPARTAAIFVAIYVLDRYLTR